jgi:hypothetical protein
MSTYTSTYTPRFKDGDEVMVVGPMLGKKGPKVPRPGVIVQVDRHDPTWSYNVQLTWRGRSSEEWFREENVQPAAPPLKVPRFTTQAEADAWLTKHA